jgi:hypothetical protein
MAKTLREQLIGTWKLVSYVEKPTDGSEPFYPMRRRKGCGWAACRRSGIGQRPAS